MIKYFYFILAFTLINTVTPFAKAIDMPSQTTLQKIVDKLDVTSFNNSIGPRREKGKVTFKDYGVTKVKFDDTQAVVSELDDSWRFFITLLSKKINQIKICFEDQAKNGGTYHTQAAYLLTLSKSNLLQASPVDDPACPSFAD